MNRAEVVLVAGEGGHHTQMLRLASLLRGRGQAVSFICEGAVPDKGQVRVWYPGRISKISKTGRFRSCYLFFYGFCLMVLSFISFFRERPLGVVFHGPLFCIPVVFVCLVLRIKCVYLESWSKFSSPSKSGRLCDLLGVPIYYQNKELGSVYRNGTYAGRL